MGLYARDALGFLEDVPPARTLLDDPVAARAYVTQCERRSSRRGAPAYDLVTSPERVRSRLIGFLRECSGALFASEWRLLHDRLEPAVARLRTDVRRRGLAEVLAGLNPTAVVWR